MTAPTLASASVNTLQRALQGPGLWLDIGSATLRVSGRSPHLPAQLQAAYPHFALVDAGPWADVHLRMEPVAGVRRWWRPQVQLLSDGRTPYQPFAADHPLPMFEWGANLLIGQQFNHLLLLHAGVVERDGLALMLPALPGSGKSTLTAALSLSGWRILSDEFGAFDPAAGAFRAMLKPVALKNRSIEVIRGFSAQAQLGPTFPNTRKGDVAHLAATPQAVAGRHELAHPAAVVLPRWVEGSATQLEPLGADAMFRALAFNAFNYQTLGEVGFDAVLAMSRGCLGWSLVYSDLASALAALDDLWPAVRAHHQANE
jgi:HprK-related kinase A